jgi:signal transduction histidine kinase
LDRARSRFITNVSHQLRTPVTNMKLYARLLRTGRNPDKSDHYLNVLENQANQLSDLIQDILEVTTLDGGQAVSDWEPVNVSDVILAAVERYEEQARKGNLILAVGPGASGYVSGDASRLTQAVAELVENAVEFTSPGGRIRVSAQTVEQAGKRWETISVEDSGPGIPAEERERIFDQFYRGSLAESGHITGTGLGLSIVREIIGAHGGRVVLEGQGASGGGSTFTVWLPSMDA